MPCQPYEVWEKLFSEKIIKLLVYFSLICKEIIDEIRINNTTAFGQQSHHLHSPVTPNQALSNQESLELQYALQRKP